MKSSRGKEVRKRERIEEIIRERGTIMIWCAHSDALYDIDIRPYVHARTHINAHLYTHVHTHSLSHTHTNTYTHTHTQ